MGCLDVIFSVQARTSVSFCSAIRFFLYLFWCRWSKDTETDVYKDNLVAVIENLLDKVLVQSH